MFIFFVFTLRLCICLNIYRGQPATLASDSENIEHQVYGRDEEPSVIVQLTNRVQDGTRCRPGSLDMCIQGKCQVCNVLKQAIILNYPYLLLK